jgi:hypothetical protein
MLIQLKASKNKENKQLQVLQHSAKVQGPLIASHYNYTQTLDIISNHRILHCGHGIIQAKLKIGQPNDVYEQEADRVADTVMRIPDSQVQRKSPWNEDEEDPIQMKPVSGQSTTLVQRKSPWNEDEEDPIQMKSNWGQIPVISSGLESQIHALKGGGEPLPQGTKRFMETAFNADFSGVRVHTDRQASSLSKRISAKAFTLGNDIYFNEGYYSPASPHGMKLLSHELTHVLQQKSSIQTKKIQRVTSGESAQCEVKEEGGEIKSDCPVNTTGTISEVSWGETSGIYPGKDNKWVPSKWDGSKLCELLRLRGAIHEVGKRGEKVHKAKPGNSAIEKKLKPYHYIENFLPLDVEISDSGVKWFYLSPKIDLQTHPTMSKLVWAKKYGPFYNIGGGDVKDGDIYVHFYKQ